MKNYTQGGTLKLYSRDYVFVKARQYSCKKERNEIIEGWKKEYPHKIFYVVICPFVKH